MKFNVKQKEGRTLIALIITIIVMIILVAVTVTLAMQGNLFGTAREAGEGTKEQVDKETLQGAIVGALDVEMQIIDVEKLKSNLSDWNIDGEGEGPFICTSLKGNQFTVGIDGTIKEDIDISKLPENNLVRMYSENRLRQGDYVRYTPDVVTQSYNPDGGQGVGALTGSTTAQTITQEELNWRVLGFDNVSNKLLLISGAPTDTTLSFGRYVGYNNYISIINEVCNKFYSSNIGVARSINMNDIDTYLDGKNFNKEEYNGGSSNPGGYGYTKEFTDIYNPEQWDGKWSGALISTNYYYDINNVVTDETKKEILQGKNQDSLYNYSIANRYVIVNEDSANWDLGFFMGGYVFAGLTGICSSGGERPRSADSFTKMLKTCCCS